VFFAFLAFSFDYISHAFDYQKALSTLIAETSRME